MAETTKENSSSVDLLAGIVAEFPKENLLSIDLLASITTAVINVDGSIPSNEMLQEKILNANSTEVIPPNIVIAQNAYNL